MSKRCLVADHVRTDDAADLAVPDRKVDAVADFHAITLFRNHANNWVFQFGSIRRRSA